MGKMVGYMKQTGVLVSDGAWGTFLQEKGLKPGSCPEEWNFSHPEQVYDIARSYIEAGADMIETNSFGGTVYKLERYGLGNKVFELNKAAAEISRKAAGNKFVLGSVGPTGKLLLMGDVSAEELYQAFKVQVTGLMEGGADAIMIETMSDLDEALIAIRAAKEFTNLEVFCTMTFEKTLTGDYRTMMGITPTEMVHALIPAGVDVTGANCGNGMADMLKIVEEIRSINFQIPVLVHANAGMPVLNDGITIYPEKPEDMGALVPPLIKAGVNIIGGCCGTTPNHIMKIRQALKLY